MNKKVMIICALAIVFLATPVLAKGPFAVAPGQAAAEATDDSATLKQKIEDFKNARTELKEQRKTQVLTTAKTIAKRHIDNLIAKFTRIKTRINNMKVISDPKKKELSDKIDAEIKKLQAEKPKIEAATTAEEVRAILKEVREQAKSSVNIVQEIVKAIHSTHLSDIQTRLQNILNKLTVKVTDLKSQGKSVADLEALETQAKTALDTAGTKITSNDFKAAKDSLLEARQKLVELAQKVKALTVTTE